MLVLWHNKKYMFNANSFEVGGNNEIVPTLEEVIESLSCDQGKMGEYLRVALGEPDKNMQPSMMIKRVIQLACTEVGLDADKIESDLEEGRRDYSSILMKNYLSEFRKQKEERDLRDMGTQVNDESRKTFVTEEMINDARLKEMRDEKHSRGL